METLRIEIPFDKEEFLESQKIKWAFLWRNEMTKMVAWLIAAIILIIAGLLLLKDGEPFNVFLFIGALFLLNAILTWQSRFFSHRNQVKQTKMLAEKYESMGLLCVYEFTDESLDYSDNEKHFNLNWDLFRYYTLYKGYLILFIGEFLIDIVMFKQESTEEKALQYDKIHEFVKIKLKHRNL
jgi:hypothetical protein